MYRTAPMSDDATLPSRPCALRNGPAAEQPDRRSIAHGTAA
jgi:hypothetical protein